MSNNVFPKIVPFVRYCRKMWGSQRSHRRQYNTAHALCMLGTWGYTRQRAHTHACTHLHACAHSRKHVILILFTRKHSFRDCPSMLCYTYITTLVNIVTTTGASWDCGWRRRSPDMEAVLKVTNKQSRTEDRGSSPSLWVERDANNSSPTRKQTCNEKLQVDSDGFFVTA